MRCFMVEGLRFGDPPWGLGLKGLGLEFGAWGFEFFNGHQNPRPWSLATKSLERQGPNVKDTQ